MSRTTQSPASAIASAGQQRPGLVARFLVLRRRIRVGDDAGAGLHAGASVADRDRADRDAEVEVAGEVDVADRAGVDVAARRLELRRGSASRESSARPTPCRPGSRRRAHRGDRGPPPAGRRRSRPGASRASSARAPCTAAPCTEPNSQTRPRSFRPRSTSITCSARSFSLRFSSSPSRRSSSSLPPRGRVPAIGCVSTRRPSTRTSISGDDPTIASPPMRMKYMYGDGLTWRSAR